MLVDGPTPFEVQALINHRHYVEMLVHEGTALLAGRAMTGDPRDFDMVVFKADDRESAERLVAIDPAVVDGVATAELFPFRIELLSETWEP